MNYICQFLLILDCQTCNGFSGRDNSYLYQRGKSSPPYCNWQPISAEGVDRRRRSTYLAPIENMSLGAAMLGQPISGRNIWRRVENLFVLS